MNNLPPATRGDRNFNASQSQDTMALFGQSKLRNTPLDTAKFIPYDAVEVPLCSAHEDEFEDGQVVVSGGNVGNIPDTSIHEPGWDDWSEEKKKYNEFLKMKGFSYEDIMQVRGTVQREEGSNSVGERCKNEEKECIKEGTSKNAAGPIPCSTPNKAGDKSWKDVVADKSYPKFRLTYHAPSITDKRIIVSPPLEVATCGYEKWENSMVGCFLGRSLPYTLVCNIAHRLWDKFGLQKLWGIIMAITFSCLRMLV